MTDPKTSALNDLLRGAQTSRARIDALHIFSLTAIALAQPLYTFLEANPAYFVTQRLQPAVIIWFMAILSLALPAILAILPPLISRIHPKSGTITRIFIITTLFALTFSPMTRHIPGYFLGFLPDWTALIASVAIGIVLAHQYFTNKFLNLLLLVLTPLILYAPGRLLFDGDMRQILHSRADYMIDIPPVTPQTTPPIVFIVFDELPTLSLLDAEGHLDEDRFPNFARLAENATWYSRATTVHDYTLKAVPSIVTGQLPMAGPILPLLPNYPTSIFHLLSDAYSLNTRELVTHLNPNATTEHNTAHASLLSFAMDLAAMYAHTILPEDMAQSLAPMDDNLWGGFFVQQGNAPGAMPAGVHRWLEDQLGAEDEGDQVAQFRNFLESISAEDSGALHFLHVNLPHRPFVRLPSGRLYNATDWLNASLDSGDKPHYRHQLRRAHLLQTGLADTLLGELIDTLQQRGIFDESMIVIVADHGMSFRDIAHDRELTKENFPDIAYVPLLIKYPNQTDGRVDATNVQTIDIVPTILDALGCESTPRLDGRSLLDSSASPPETKFAMNRIDTIFRVPNTTANDQFNAALATMTAEFHLENPESTLFQFGPRLDALGLNESDIAPRTLSATITLNNPAALQSPRSVATLNALVTGTVTLDSARVGENLQVLVALNGTIAAQTPLLTIGSERRFYTVLPEDQIHPERNTLAAYVLPDEPIAER